MGKPILIIFFLLAIVGGVFIGGAESVSQQIEKYTEDNYKQDPVNHEKYTFMNAVYCNWTAKYTRALELLDKYDQRYVLDENREKSIFLRAKTYDNMIDGRKAKGEYKKYMDEFPEGKHFEKARERYNDLKTYT
jgi:hypothetical protein